METEYLALNARYCAECKAVFHVGTDDERIMAEHCKERTRFVPDFQGDWLSRKTQYRHYLGLVGSGNAV